MASWLSLLRRFLPFATSGTPLVQDLAHLAVVCALLYFAPQIQDYIQSASWQSSGEGAEAADEAHHELDVDDADDGNEAADEDQELPAHNEDVDEAAAVQLQEEDRAVPGPANAPSDSSQRNVGAKKAKSLARRDQRRAYHEFMRSQGDAQRAQDAEGAEERELAQAAERERRKAAEAKLEAKKAKEREQRRETERREREAEQARRERCVAITRRELSQRRSCNVFEVAKAVGGDVDDEWVLKILTASGMLGRSVDGAMTIASQTGWVVRVREEDMALLYEAAAKAASANEEGKVSYDQMSSLLESILVR